MRFYSTNSKESLVTFEEALLTGMPADYGLYMMDKTSIPIYTQNDLALMRGMSYAEIAYKVLTPFLAEEFEADTLRALLSEAYDEAYIKAPLQKVDDSTDILWLTQGPTCSFKDFAARFFGRTLNHFLKLRGKRRLVVVATSGDTGGAIADALHKLDSVFCVVLYPAEGVSEVQRRQMTTLGDNVYAVAIQGDFDVCQALAKRLLNDSEYATRTFNDPAFITSANSISLGRLLPQIVFPFYAYSRMNIGVGEPIVLSIPSGNFGDMMGSVIAKHMGLPIEKIICGVNENKTFSDFLITGEYSVRPAVYSPSSAMIVSHPSNVIRLIDLYGGHIYDERDASGKVVRAGVIDIQPDMLSMRRDIYSCSVDNKQHYETMKRFFADTGIIVEPHGAVGIETLAIFREQFDSRTHAVIYETADPAKFPVDVVEALARAPEIPEQIERQKKLPERIFTMQQASIISPMLGKTCSEEQYQELTEHIASWKLV
jgi:threonine synthase